MARRRFLVEQVHNGIAEIRGADACHLTRVLRTESGRQYEVSDGASVYLAEVQSASEDQVTLRILEELTTPPAVAQLTILAGLTKFNRFEWMIEKATELGASAIIPVISDRSEKGLEAAAAKRLDRWRRIAHESTQQSRRLSPPEIRPPLELTAALHSSDTHRLFLDETPGASPLQASLPAARHSTDTIALLIGPEGGWTPDERAQAIAATWQAVSLGPQILRAETAAIAAAALLMHVWWASQLE